MGIGLPELFPGPAQSGLPLGSSSITRMQDMQVDDYLLTSTIDGVLAQLETVETAEEFDQAIEGLLGPFLGGMMGPDEDESYGYYEDESYDYDEDESYDDDLEEDPDSE